MSGSPFRARVIPPDEVRKIVRRAVDLAASSGTAGHALTPAELGDHLEKLGIPADLTARAIDATTTPPNPTSADGATRIVREVTVEGVVPPERHEDVADGIGSAMNIVGRVSVVGQKLTWVPGVLTEPAITVHSKDGRTRIHYVETLAAHSPMIGFAAMACLGAVFVGIATLLVGIAIAKSAEISARQGAPFVFAMAAVVAIATAIGATLAMRQAFVRRTQTRATLADDVMAHVVTVTRDAIEPRATRVDGSAVRVAEEAEDLEEEPASGAAEMRRARR